jgi:hypothetical protein
VNLKSIIKKVTYVQSEINFGIEQQEINFEASSETENNDF